MVRFPDVLLKPEYGYQANQLEKVKRTDSELGSSAVRDAWNRTRFICAGAFKLTVDMTETYYAFWRINRLSQNITFFDYDETAQTAVAIGTGTGAQTVFTLNAREVRAAVFKVAGTITAATISVGTGALGEDQITFAAPPANATAITGDYTGRKKYTVEYLDTPHRDAVSWNLRRVTFALREVF